MQMKFAESAENVRKSGACEGMSEAQTKKVVIGTLAATTNLSVDELTTRLNNKEHIAPRIRKDRKNRCGDCGVPAESG